MAKSEASKEIETKTSAPHNKKATPIVFSLDDVEAVVATRKKEKAEVKESTMPDKPKAVAKKAPAQPIEVQPAEKRKLGAASLADILGFNPAEKTKPTNLEGDKIPAKWKKYYALLLDLRNHVSEELSLHTNDTLKHTSREDSGDSSGYGNHQADAGTDAFDRDFALSLVSNEQEALNEIEEAILRIKDGTYGICEITGEPINAERLEAVPFTRYSLQGQTEFEKNKRHKVKRQSGSLFSDTSDAVKITSDDDDDS